MARRSRKDRSRKARNKGATLGRQLEKDCTTQTEVPIKQKQASRAQESEQCNRGVCVLCGNLDVLRVFLYVGDFGDADNVSS